MLFDIQNVSVIDESILCIDRNHRIIPRRIGYVEADCAIQASVILDLLVRDGAYPRSSYLVRCEQYASWLEMPTFNDMYEQISEAPYIPVFVPPPTPKPGAIRALPTMNMEVVRTEKAIVAVSERRSRLPFPSAASYKIIDKRRGSDAPKV
jgi:hypothetical protein